MTDSSNHNNGTTTASTSNGISTVISSVVDTEQKEEHDDDDQQQQESEQVTYQSSSLEISNDPPQPVFRNHTAADGDGEDDDAVKPKDNDNNKKHLEKEDMDKEEEEEEEAEDWTIQRDIYKYEGDNAYRNQQYHSAIHYYTLALSLDPTNGTILCNRSASYMKINYITKALQDALLSIPTMQNKGKCRTAMAYQSLHRYQDAISYYQSIVNDDPKYTAAQTGLLFCQQQLQQQQQQQSTNLNEEEERELTTIVNDDTKAITAQEPIDDLDDFFNDVDDVVQTTVIQSKQQTTNAGTMNELQNNQATTDAILIHKRGLGTVQQQVERLTQTNYKWYNLNPFYVLDLPALSSTTTTMEISRRYKALSLLLHPDRFHNNNNHINDTNPTVTKEQVQLAYDQVLHAKAILDNEDKVKHIRDLIEEGMKQGKVDYQKQQSQRHPITKQQAYATTTNDDNDDVMTLDEYQNRAIHRIFATMEYTRQQVLERERSFVQKQQESSDHIVNKERQHHTHDQAWQQSDRVDTRIGDWRSFTSNKKQKKAKKI